MTANRTCPECQALLPADAPAGLCPRCLLQRGLGSDTSGVTTGFGPFAPPSVDELRPLFPQLEIIELLGQGGMGAVYKARQTQLDRLVALKILPPAADASFAERFTREARTLAKLSHPGIVTVFDFGQAGGFYYFVMEFVEGVNLRQAQRAHKLAPAEALAIVPKICEALQVAHDANVVHRDIKPENILLDAKGRVKIADFGLAKLLHHNAEQSNLTHTHQAMGTMHYMAPEQWEKPQTVDHRADIYSLGVVFYELLTGELPLGRFAVPSQKVQVDVRLDDIVLRTLEKEPDRRYQHASDVKSDVEKISVAKASIPNDDAAVSIGQMALLLDQTDQVSRQFQHMLLLAGAFLLLVGVVLLSVTSTLPLKWLGGSSLGVAVVMFLIAGRVKQHWECIYKGRRVIFENSVYTGEKLFIDGALMARGGFGRRMEIAGTIPGGAGAGDRIIAWTDARFQTFRLRLFAEPATNATQLSAAPSNEMGRATEKRMAASKTSSRLWLVASILLIATVTTISAPPYVVFDLPLPGKIILAVATLVFALAAVIASTRDKRPTALESDLRYRPISDEKADKERLGDTSVAMPAQVQASDFVRAVLQPVGYMFGIWCGGWVLATRFENATIRSFGDIVIAMISFLGPVIGVVLLVRWLNRTLRPKQPVPFWIATVGLCFGALVLYSGAVAMIFLRQFDAPMDSGSVETAKRLLIGKWDWTDGRAGTSEFRADGTFEDRWHMKVNDTTDGAIDPDKPLVEKEFREAGQYRWLGNMNPTMVVWSPGKPERSLGVVVTENELTLKEGDGGVHRMKRQINPSAPVDLKKAILGTWEVQGAKRNIVGMAFRGNGTYENYFASGSRNVGTYHWLDDERIEKVFQGNVRNEYKVAMDGDALTLLEEKTGQLYRMKRSP